jgi:CRP-like cAMP-binding protein
MTPQPDLLAGLGDRDAADVLALGLPVSLEAGDILFRLGAEAANLYVIQSGLITLTMPMQVAGREEDVRIEERLPGQTLGWSTLIPPHRFTLTAQAPVVSELLAFPRSRLLHHFESRPAVGYVVSRNVAALVGQRLQVFQAMWLRQVQHMVNTAHV